MRKRNVVIVLVGALLALSGCGDDNESPTPTEELVTVHNVDVNGKNVPCVVYDDSNYGSELSCNWGAYNE